MKSGETQAWQVTFAEYKTSGLSIVSLPRIAHGLCTVSCPGWIGGDASRLGYTRSWQLGRAVAFMVSYAAYSLTSVGRTSNWVGDDHLLHIFCFLL